MVEKDIKQFSLGSNGKTKGNPGRSRNRNKNKRRNPGMGSQICLSGIYNICGDGDGLEEIRHEEACYGKKQ